MKPLIIANWKMNPANLKEAFDLAGAVTKGVKDVAVDVVLCPPFPYISELLPSLNVSIGAQDCFWEQEGAFTGEVSPAMLKNLGCSYVILGHSERRKYLAETNEMINQKILAVLEARIIPIVCIGENIEKDLPVILNGIQDEDLNRMVFAYEPEWAISTGKNAKPASSEQTSKAIKDIRDIVGKEASILYGGSVNSKDIRNIFDTKEMQGVLVGASSLDAEEFIALAKNMV